MPSSISSSEAAVPQSLSDAWRAPKASPCRSASSARASCASPPSDRPGVAQPVPERDIPPQPWGRILLGALRAVPAADGRRGNGIGAISAPTPGYRNSNGAWAEQRRRIDAGRRRQDRADRFLAHAVRRAAAGVGTPRRRAADPARAGRHLAGAGAGGSGRRIPTSPAGWWWASRPDLFFSGFAYRGEAIEHFHKQGPSQRSGHWLSKRLLEPYFAFYDPDFALATRGPAPGLAAASAACARTRACAS